MLTVDLKAEGLNEVTRAVMQLPGLFARARKSALGSTGNWIRQELRDYVESGGEEWPKLHPLTQKWRKFRRAGDTPLFYLGRFVRYLIDQEGTTIEIGLGKSGKGEPGQVDDPWLMAALRRAEYGEKTKVTRMVRMVWLSTKIYGKQHASKYWTKNPRSGATIFMPGAYFVLRPDTQFITIPKRPVIGPVFRKVRSKVMPYFEDKFWKAIERYRSGAAKS